MRNKKLIVTITVLLLVVFMLSMALVACKKTTKGGENEENKSGEIQESGNPKPVKPGPPDDDDDDGDQEDPGPQIPSYADNFKDAMTYMIGAMPSKYMSFNFDGFVTVKDKKYVMSLRSNVAESELELSATFKLEGTDEIAFAVYIVNSKLFIQTKDKETDEDIILHVSEIDVDYLLSIVDKLPDVISDLLGGLTGGMDLSGIINFALKQLLNGFAPQDYIVYTSEDGVENFQFRIDLQGLLKPLIGLLGKGGIIGQFLPEGLDISFVSDILALIPLINGDIKATVDNGVLSEFSVELRNNDKTSENYKQPIFGINDVITFSDQKLDLDIPQELYEEMLNYDTISLGNLNVDLSLELDTGDEEFDAGALIDAFLGKTMFGEGILVLNAHANYRLDIQASLDTNVFESATDRNYIHIVLWAGENEIARANYLNGKLYLKILANGVNGFADGGINIAIDLPLNDYISQLVELLTGYIDGFLGTQFRPGEAEATAALASSIISASVTRSGEVILSQSVQDIIVKILGLLGMQECVDMEGGDHISIIIDKKLFDAIKELGGKDDKGNYKLELPAFLDQIFGELKIGLFKGGIEYVEINAMDILTFRAENFYIGRAKIDEDFVLNSEYGIGDISDYGEDFESIILNFALNLLSDLELNLELDLSTVKSVVNLTPIINGIMAMANNSTYLPMPIEIDFSKYTGKFKLRIASYFDKEVTGDGRILIELITPQGDTLISAYNENSDTYLDLSGLGFMKVHLTGVNVFELIRGALGDNALTEDAMEEVSDTYLSSGVIIEDDNIGMAVESYIITLILRMVGMDLGLDLGLQAYLRFDGSVSAALSLGNVADIALDLSLGKASFVMDEIITKTEDCKKNTDYGVYDATSGAETFVESILTAQKLELVIDIYNNNVLKHSHENKTRIVIKKSTAVKGGPAQQVHLYDKKYLDAPYNSIIVGIYDGWSTAAPWAYVVLDVEAAEGANDMSIRITKASLEGVSTSEGGFTAGLASTFLGTINDNLNFKVGVKSLLVNMLKPIFEASASASGGIIDVPEGALPEQKPFGHECGHKCVVCGGCRDANCADPVCRDNRCSETAQEKHHNCAHKCPTCGKCYDNNCSDPSCGYTSDYSDKCSSNGNHHICGHKCEICGDCLDTACSKPECKLHRCDGSKHEKTDIMSIIDKVRLTLTGSMDIDANIKLNGPMVSALLSNLLKSVFNDMDISKMAKDASMNHQHVDYDNTDGEALLTGLYDNLLSPILKGVSSALGVLNLKGVVRNFLTKFLPLSDVQDLDVNVALTDGKLSYIEIIGDNDKGATYDDYSYGIYIFNKHADNVVSFGHQETEVYYNRNLANENYTLKGMFVEQAQTQVSGSWERDSKQDIVWTTQVDGIEVTLESFNDNLSSYSDGLYTFTGAAWGKTITVKLILDSVQITGVKDMTVKAMREIPNYVTVEFGDEERIISDVDIVCDGRVNGEKNASVKLGGETYQFTITFEEENISLDTLQLNAYDYQDTLNAMDEAGTIRVKVNDTFYRNLPAKFNWTSDVKDSKGNYINIKEMARRDAQKAAVYHVKVEVGEGTEYYNPSMTLTVEFKPFDILYIERNGKNYIETDYIEYANGQSFPDEITVVGTTGKDKEGKDILLKYTANIEWKKTADGKNIKGVNMDLKGGQYFAEAIINKGDYNQWTLYGIEVNVLPCDIVDLAPNNKTVTLDWKYHVYGGKDANGKSVITLADCITSLLDFRTSKNTIVEDVPVTIDIKKIRDNYNEYLARSLNGEELKVQCPVYIDVTGVDEDDDDPLYKTNIIVKLPSLKMSLIEDEIEIDVSDESFSGLDAYFKALSKMEIKLGNDTVMAKVTWDTADVIYNVDGTYTATVSIAIGDEMLEQSCEVTIRINGNTQEEVE